MSHKHDHHHNSRRNFIRTMGCASMSLAPMLSTITNLGLINAAAANNMPYFADSNYKALVCVALDGGNDSFNMLVPHGQSAYNTYAATRGNIAIDRNELLQINSVGNSNETTGEYGLHPSMPNLKAMYDNNNLAFVANVGTLVERTDINAYNNFSNLPVGLYSHIDQLSLWQTSIPNVRSNIGWSGRMADLLQSQCNPNSNVSMNISIAGSNIFQHGNISNQYTIKPVGSNILRGTGRNEVWNDIKLATADNLMSENYQNILKTAYKDVYHSAQSVGNEFTIATSGINLSTEFPNTYLGNQLKMAAKTISARNVLNMNRQVFYVKFGEFDSHGSTAYNGGTHARDLQQLDEALKSFADAMTELGLTDEVTTFTMSDFGRTMELNSGLGTDHGWGGNSFVMGGAVNGGKIYGQYPDLSIGNVLDTGEGRLIPTTSCDEYFGDLALWFADNGSSTLSSGQLETILPNLTPNFWNYQSGQKPIGFMS